MSRVDLFRSLIDEPEAEGIPRDVAELLQPLDDLAEALRDEASVGAAVQASNDGLRRHLVLWPLHRPKLRSRTLTIYLTKNGGILVGTPRCSFATADALTTWLESFLRRPEFRATLDDLRALAMEPVDGRLERENGMATIVAIPPGVQAKLGAEPDGKEVELRLELEDGEPVPDGAALRRLDAAGIVFTIQKAEVAGRTVHVTAIKT